LTLLPAETDRVWRFLREQPALAGFVLGGGSALALHIGHRLSEDLDFIYPHVELPRNRLDALRRAAAARGFEFTANDSEAAIEEFAVAGMELHDFQQDFLVDREVKVSFFAADEPLRRILAPGAGFGESVRLATLSECFRAKSIVSAVRSKSRDWLDLYLLMREHGFSIQDYRRAFIDAGIPGQCDAGLTRMCNGVVPRDDEGYQHLLANPPTLAAMTEFFIAQRDQLEIETAAEAKKRNS
jgi:hypothetical protein